MRLAVLLASFLVACASAPPERNGEQAEVEAALARVVAVAAAPESDAATFAALVAYRGGDANRDWRAPVEAEAPTERAQAAALLSQFRAILAKESAPDGRFVYRVAEYVREPTEVADWHVLRLAIGAASGERTTEVEVAFVPGPDGYLVGRVSE